jgi:tetratricopeptide (TPR) repeat protein
MNHPLFALLALAFAVLAADDDTVQRAVSIAYESKDAAVIAQAAQVIEAHLRLVPDDLERRKALAVIYLDKLQQPQQALPHLENVRQAEPDDANWMQALARAKRGIGERAEAAALYAQAAQLSPRDIWIRYEHARTLGELGRHEEAVAALRAAQTIDPENQDVRVALSAQLAVLQERQAKVKKTSDVWRERPVSTVVQAERAAYQSGRVEDFTHAAELLENALRRAPGDLAKRKSLGFIYLEKLDAPALAVPHLEKVVMASPRDAGWLVLLARAQARLGRHEEAADSYRRAAGLTPHDPWTHYHLAEHLAKLNRPNEALAAIDEALALEPNNAYARALRGDLHRAAGDPAAARAEYDRALAADGKCSTALAGLDALRKQQRTEAKLGLYHFDDTDGLRQTGIFASGSVYLRDGWRFGLSASEWFFDQAPGETIERFELGLNVSYQPSRWLVLSAGANFFKTQNAGREYGADFAAYYLPHTAFDAWLSYRPHTPVNDSYLTARDSFTQDVWAAGVNFRPSRAVTLSAKASHADYSDGNTRRAALVSVAWLASARANATLKLEWEWLDYDLRSPGYSSPSDYHLLRPVLEVKPRITDWLALEMRGELTYVADEADWGTGFRAGPRLYFGDYGELGAAFLKYEIPSEVTTWSGEGWLIDFTYRF